MTIQSEKGKELVALAGDYQAASDTLKQKVGSAPIKELTDLLADYNQLAQRMKEQGLNIESLTEAYFEKITERVATRTEELLENLNLKELERAHKVFTKNPAQYFKHATERCKEFLCFEEDAAVFASKQILAGDYKCALKLHESGEFEIGIIKDDDRFESASDRSKLCWEASEILWYAGVINLAKRYQRLLEE